MSKPLIIGVTGAVAVGKSTFSRTLASELRFNKQLQEIYFGEEVQFHDQVKIEIIATDNFLFSNAELEEKGLTDKKGFPESYNSYELGEFIFKLKAGEKAECAVYSHEIYDIEPEKRQEVENVDILILEGVAIKLVEEMIDVLVFLDADKQNIYKWYRNRYLEQIELAKNNSSSWYNKFANMELQEIDRIGEKAWTQINEPNYYENIEPLRKKANIIIKFDSNHKIENVGKVEKNGK